MNERNRYILLTLFYIGILVLLAYLMPKKLDWRPTFAKADTIPFGNKILHNELSSLYPDCDVVTSEVPIVNTVADGLDSNSLYFFVTQNFNPDKLDIDKLLQFVGKGNDAFISAQSFNFDFIDTLHIRLDSDVSFPTAAKSADDYTLLNPSFETRNFEFNTKASSYTWFVRESDSIPAIALGEINLTEPNFIEIPWQKGKLVLHCSPKVFTNYGMVDLEMSTYISNCFSYFRPDKLIWDEYYKPGNTAGGKSPLNVMMKNPSFQWAWYIILFSLAVFLIWYGKRRQRIIPILDPFKNESLEFAKTIGDLYFQTGNNKDLFEKKLLMLREHFRSSLFIKDATFDDTLAKRVAIKSGHSIEKVQSLFNSINSLSEKKALSNKELISFSKSYNEFFNR